MSDVRVRFAPSPTGFFHIGSARTALFNWLYARHTGGVFVLRIEDTDQQRNTDEALRVLLEGMRWLGLDWDEGPEVGGEFGPYFQSQRGDIYQKAVAKLLEKGRAYESEGAVFFRLEGERYREMDDYLGKEVEKVRTRPMVFEDQVRGRIERAVDRDFPIVRANGEPVFHLVNVVDDIEMGITHVIRGEDHLTNTARHLELFHALEATPPQYAHLPLILKDPSMGKGKMSKRDKGALIEEYEQRHFLGEAVRNFLCLLGWNPKDDREIMPIDDIIQLFDFPGIQKGAAKFDEKKLQFMNGMYLRNLPLETYTWLAKPILESAGLLHEEISEDNLQSILSVCRPKLDLLENLPEYTAYLFSEQYPYSKDDFQKISKKADPQQLAKELREVMEQSGKDLTAEHLSDITDAAAEAHQRKPNQYLPIIRYAIAGTLSGPDLKEIIQILGAESVSKRLEAFIKMDTHGLSLSST